MAFVERPFEGLPAEADLVAMREILPLATLPATTTEEYGSADVVLTTILPSMAGRCAGPTACVWSPRRRS